MSLQFWYELLLILSSKLKQSPEKVLIQHKAKLLFRCFVNLEKQKQKIKASICDQPTFFTGQESNLLIIQSKLKIIQVELSTLFKTVISILFKVLQSLVKDLEPATFNLHSISSSKFIIKVLNMVENKVIKGAETYKIVYGEPFEK